MPLRPAPPSGLQWQSVQVPPWALTQAEVPWTVLALSPTTAAQPDAGSSTTSVYSAREQKHYRKLTLLLFVCFCSVTEPEALPEE